MRFLLILFSTLFSPACIYIGELPKDGFLDTGTAHHNEVASERLFTATPDIIEPQQPTLVVLEADHDFDFSLVQDVYALGDAEVIAFRSTTRTLHLKMIALEQTESNTVHLVLDMGNEEMEVARDIITVESADIPVPPEDEDTTEEEREPIQ